MGGAYGASVAEGDFSDTDTTEDPKEQNTSITEDGEGDSDMCAKEGTRGPTQENVLGIKGVYPT